MNKIAAFKALIINRKSLIVILLSIFYFPFTIYFTTPVHAQDPVPCPSPPPNVKAAIDNVNKAAIQQNVFDDKIFNLNQISGTVDSLATILIGCSQLHPEINETTAGTGALTLTGRLIANLYGAPPASGVQYFANQFQKFNPVQPAYAQAEGIGFSALQPVQRIWTAFRNISYVGFVIIFVIIGFMIMFRAHISPQAVATIQDSIPRIVVALILVTFSYAIAGLMIDIMFVFLNIVINALQQANLLSPEGGGQVFTKSVFGVIFGLWTSAFQAVFNAIYNVINDVVKLPGIFDNLFGWLGGGIAALVLGIALLFIMFRVFFMLLMAYVMIIILTMVAPFFFLIQALPGNTGAREWFKQMTANVSVFPVTALMFIFAGILANLSGFTGGGAGPFSGEEGRQAIGQFPLLTGDIKFKDIGALIGIGFLLMTPEAANLVKNAIGAKGPQFGGAGVAALGGAAGVAYTGTGARAAVGSVGGAFRMAGQERQEWLGARIPYIGGALRARRKALKIEE